MTLTVIEEKKTIKELSDVWYITIGDGVVTYLPMGVYPEDLSFDKPTPYWIKLESGQTAMIN